MKPNMADQIDSGNDPWSPLPEKTDIKPISQPPADPRYQLIDSGRYIESLEKKLKHIKGKQKPEPSSRDIIGSLACFRNDQMRRFMDREQSVNVTASSSVVSDQALAAAGSTSYFQRRLHPERQAINMEELFELLKDDELARNRTEQEEEDSIGPGTLDTFETKNERSDNVETVENEVHNAYTEREDSEEKNICCDEGRESDSNEGER